MSKTRLALIPALMCTVVVLGACLLPSATPSPTPTPDDVALYIIDLVNEERERAGVQPLAINEQLMLLAQQRSDDMVTGDYFSHHAPPGHPQLHELNMQLGHDRLSTPIENLVYVVGPTLDGSANAAVDSWRGSRDHWRWAIAEGVTMTGVGVAADDEGVIITQLFWGPATLTPHDAFLYNR